MVEKALDKKILKYPTIGYPGGKARVANKIVAKIPPHTKYVEPFAGAAHVFFKKPKAEKNVLNDVNRELMGFFKDVKDKKFCCKITDTKENWRKIKEKQIKTPCDVMFLNKTNYGSKGIFTGQSTYANRKKKIDREACFDGSKLSGVDLTTKDFRETMNEHDGKNTFFYIDPPYVKANEGSCLYGKGKCEVTPQQVADAVKKIDGKALVSYDDHPAVRKAFKGFKMEKITLPYTFARDKDKKVKGKTKELLIRNY